MFIRSVGHACLEIETKGLRLLTDPWWAGPAYTNQWHPWPTPRPDGVQERDVDYVYVSHGHEDHLHADTLRTLKKGGTALVPGLVSGPFGDWLKQLGFCHVIELPHGQPVQLRRGLVATCYVNMSDSLLVLEDGDRVAVVANDALHSSPRPVIDHFCRILRRNHPVIDTLFLGFAGASWFPNCLQAPGKNDLAVARQRELHLSDNFVRVVDALRPRLACAYAASFVLLEPQLRWINEVRFGLPTPDELFRRRHNGSATHTHLLLPGDVIDGLDVTRGPTPQPSRQSLEQALDNELAEASKRAMELPQLSPAEVHAFVRRLDARVRANALRLPVSDGFALDLRLRDAPDAVMHLDAKVGRARARLGPAKQSIGVLETRAEIFEALLDSDYGIESIVIGYGAVARLSKAHDYRKVIEALKLSSPRMGGVRGVARELRQRPLSVGRALWRQRWPLAISAGSRLGIFGRPFEIRTLDQEHAPPLREAA